MYFYLQVHFPKKIDASPERFFDLQIDRIDISRLDTSGPEIFIFGHGSQGSGEVSQVSHDMVQRYSNSTGELLRTHSLTYCSCDSYDKDDMCGIHHLVLGVLCLVVLCKKCQNIYLYVFEDDRNKTAYCSSEMGESVKMHSICAGPNNSLMALHETVDSKQILLFDCAEVPFTLKDRINVNIFQAVSHMYYMETTEHGGTVIMASLQNNNRFVAMYSLTNRSLVWKIENPEIDRKKLWPNAICTKQAAGYVYIGDQHNARVLGIDSNTGDVLQIISLPVPDAIKALCWDPIQSYLAIAHSKLNRDVAPYGRSEQYNITYYNVNIPNTLS